MIMIHNKLKLALVSLMMAIVFTTLSLALSMPHDPAFGESITTSNPRPLPENISVSTVVSTTDWIDLQKIKENYMAKKETNNAAMAHQFLCIAETSCEEYENNPETGWASDFVKYLFDYMGEDPISLHSGCKDDILGR